MPIMFRPILAVTALALSSLLCTAIPWSNPAHAVATEVEVTDQAVGEGIEPRRGWFVIIRYTGWIYDELAADRKGRKFINSDDRGAPVSFVYGYKRALPGLEKGIEGMKVGGRRTILIPAKYAFKGARQQPPEGVPVDSNLIIDVELVDVVPQATPLPSNE